MMLIFVIIVNLLIAPVVVDSSSASSPPPPKSSTKTHDTSSSKDGSSRIQPSGSEKMQERMGRSTLSLFGVHRSNSSLAHIGADDEMIFVRKSDGSKEPLQEHKVSSKKDSDITGSCNVK